MAQPLVLLLDWRSLCRSWARICPQWGWNGVGLHPEIDAKLAKGWLFDQQMHLFFCVGSHLGSIHDSYIIMYALHILKSDGIFNHQGWTESQKSSIPDTAGQSLSAAAASQGSRMLPALPGPSASASETLCVCLWVCPEIGDGPSKLLSFEPGNEFLSYCEKIMISNWIWEMLFFSQNPSWRLLTAVEWFLCPHKERILPQGPWTHQIHIGCLGQSYLKAQISPILVLPKALHPAGSEGYPPIQASPRNPQLDTPDRPDACEVSKFQDETMVKLWLWDGCCNCDIF